MKANSNSKVTLYACLILLSLPPLWGCGSDDDAQPTQTPTNTPTVTPTKTPTNAPQLAGNYELWHWDSSLTESNPLDRQFCSGRWQTIDATHKLVWVDEMVVLDTDTNGNYRFWRVASCSANGQDPLQPELGHGQEPTLRSTNPIVYLEGDALLAIHDGYKYTTWHINRTPDETSVSIDTVLDSGGSVVYDTDTLVYLGGGNVLQWRPTWAGSFVIFKYDYEPPTTGTQFTRDAVVVMGNWTKIDASHSLTFMGLNPQEDVVLDVDLSGNYRFWHYNRSITGQGDPLDRVIRSGTWSDINSEDGIVYLPSEKLLVVQ